MNNSSNEKKEYYSTLQEYNKKIHNQNINKDLIINDEIKIYQKPSNLQGNKLISGKNNFLSEISKQKNNDTKLNINANTNMLSISKEQSQNNERKSFKDKKMEENLESKYGKGYKILKMAGYQLGKGLGKEEQGITDPIFVKKRKERVGIKNDEENLNEDLDLGDGNNNNFILGKKRMHEEKNYEETNEEFNNFELILEEYNKDKDKDKNSEKIWNLLDEDRKIKKKYHNKGGRYFGFLKYKKKFKEDFPELKGKEINLKILSNLQKDELKEKISKMILVTKEKIIDKLRQYYENENNKFIYEKVHNNTNKEKNAINENLEDENIFLQKIQKNPKYKEPDKHESLSDIINFIDEYLNLYNINPKIYKKIMSRFTLYCLKTTISFIEEINLDIKTILDKDKGKEISIICSKIKDLLYKTFNSNEENFIGEIKNKNNNNIINPLEQDDFDYDKANDYYNMFIYQIIFNKIIFYIENKWDAQNSKPIINISHLYSQILPKSIIDILNKKISTSIINYLNKNYHFIFSQNEKANENLNIHNWIHPLLDILSLDALTSILKLIEEKIQNSIKTWNLNNYQEGYLLINLLSPWSKLFEENFWKNLYHNFFSPNIHKMFSGLYLKLEEKIEDLHCFKLMFSLNDKKIIPSKKCSKILKKYFLPKLKNFIKEKANKYRNNYEKNEMLLKWCSDAVNFIKTKNNIYEDIKDDLNDCLLLLNI